MQYANSLIAFQFGTEPFTGTDATFDVLYWFGKVVN